MSQPELDETVQTTVDQTKETMMLTNADPNAMASPAPAPSAAPEQAKYEIIKKLGKGGFAWVYLVRNIDLDRLEAMKIFNADITEDEATIDHIIKEARISANFHHQNIVTVFEVRKKGYWDIFKVSDKVRQRHSEPFAYFTMSYIEGETATSVLRRESRLSAKAAVKIGIDACAALDYAHSMGIIHRDIKPDNVLVDRQGNGIVMDFGIAKVVDQTKQTAAGTFMGTARYVSPEQASGGDIDGRTDIYSLGVALYELVTGRVPFASDQWMTVLYQHINEPPPDPDTFCPNLNRDLRAVILKMLEKKRDDRFQSAKVAGEALTRVYAKLGGDDRFTLPMDQIRTRVDIAVNDDTTEVTQLGVQETIDTRNTPHPEPPAGRTELRQKQAEAEQQKKGSPLPLFGGIAAVVIIAILIFVFTRPDAVETPVTTPDEVVERVDDTPPPVTPAPEMGALWVSAFPKGELLRVNNGDGQPVETTLGALPLRLELPEGDYKLVISYRGQTTTVDTYVSAAQALNRANAEFELEDDALLLEDLR